MQKATSIIGKRRAKFTGIEASAKVIAQKFDPDKIILFGSYASGKPTNDSKVNLLIVTKSTWDLSSQIALTFDHSFPLDIIIKTPQQIKQRLEDGDFFIQDIPNHGKVIYECR